MNPINECEPINYCTTLMSVIKMSIGLYTVGGIDRVVFVGDLLTTYAGKKSAVA